MQSLSLAQGTTAVPTPVMSWKQRQRRKNTFGFWVAVAAHVVRSRPGSGRDPTARRTAVVEAVEKVQRSVVSISSEKLASSHSRWPFSSDENQLRLVNGMGSGVLVDGRGYIVTNHHVVDKVQGVIVQLLDGSTYPARVLQSDPVMDLAVIKVDADHAAWRPSRSALPPT